MGKLETPLTWILTILILCYFTLNDYYKAKLNDKINDISWETNVEVKDIEEDFSSIDAEINVDSIIDAVLKEADSSLKIILEVEDSE